MNNYLKQSKTFGALTALVLLTSACAESESSERPGLKGSSTQTVTARPSGNIGEEAPTVANPSSTSNALGNLNNGIGSDWSALQSERLHADQARNDQDRAAGKEEAQARRDHELRMADKEAAAKEKKMLMRQIGDLSALAVMGSMIPSKECKQGIFSTIKEVGSALTEVYRPIEHAEQSSGKTLSAPPVSQTRNGIASNITGSLAATPANPGISISQAPLNFAREAMGSGVVPTQQDLTSVAVSSLPVLNVP